MGKCKLCNLLPNTELEAMLLTESSRYIASKFDIGRTTVNKHRNQCMNVIIAGKKIDKTIWEDLQSIDWTGNTGVWNTGSIETVLDNVSYDTVLEKFGHDPKKVAIKGVLRESHKEYWSTDLEKMLWKHSYSFSVERRVEGLTDDIDVVALLNALPKVTGGSKPAKGIPSTFVLDWADWQMGKKEGGGTEALIERLESAFASAIVRVEELRATGRKLEELVIVGGGDMIEGCVIYPQQVFGIDLNRREQIRNTVAAILRGLTLLAPLFETVRVVVVPGNHGEHRITGNRTEIGDNDDLLVFEMAQVGCANDPRFKHVSFEIASKEISIATNIRGWVYGITHGDVYGRGSGTGVRNKVFNWFKTMAANRHPVGASDVLLTHHFHHDAMEDWGNTLWVQNPTIDGGSHYFKEYSGHETRPGMNSWVVTDSERLQDKQILR
jgi:hypothetical protein